MESELLIADDNGVACVVAALVAHDVVDAPPEEIGRLAFTLVSPLGAEQNDRGHGRKGYPTWWESPIRFECFTRDMALGVLLLGYGLAGRVFHAPLITAEPGLQVRAIVTSNPERIAQAQTDFPGVRIHATAVEALHNSADIDLVVVANANRAHVSDARLAITAGKHVVVDKPLAGSADEGQQLADAARAAEVQLHTFQNRRWDSDFLTVQAVLASGELGTPHRLESRFERLRVEPNGNWRESADPEDLGGVLLDFGAHLVDQAIELLGPVIEVSAHARALRVPDGADDDMEILLTHTSGALSLLFGSQVSAFGHPRFSVLGTRGGLRIEESDTQESRLRAGQSPQTPDWGTESFTGELIVGLPAGESTHTRVELKTGNWKHFYGQVHAAITSAAPAPVPVADVIANLRVLDAARDSVRSSARVQLTPPATHE